MEDPQPSSPPSTELRATLARLKLDQYYDRLAENGFDSWETVCCISERDMEELGFLIGHRRIPQREVRAAIGQPQSTVSSPNCGASSQQSNTEVRTHAVLTLVFDVTLRDRALGFIE